MVSFRTIPPAYTYCNTSSRIAFVASPVAAVVKTAAVVVTAPEVLAALAAGVVVVVVHHHLFGLAAEAAPKAPAEHAAAMAAEEPAQAVEQKLAPGHARSHGPRAAQE